VSDWRLRRRAVSRSAWPPKSTNDRTGGVRAQTYKAFVPRKATTAKNWRRAGIGRSPIFFCCGGRKSFITLRTAALLPAWMADGTFSGRRAPPMRRAGSSEGGSMFNRCRGFCFKRSEGRSVRAPTSGLGGDRQWGGFTGFGGCPVIRQRIAPEARGADTDTSAGPQRDDEIIYGDAFKRARPPVNLIWSGLSGIDVFRERQFSLAGWISHQFGRARRGCKAAALAGCRRRSGIAGVVWRELRPAAFAGFSALWAYSKSSDGPSRCCSAIGTGSGSQELRAAARQAFRSVVRPRRPG